ncbi:MAG: VWA domain-containing protein [Candidatus Riflebacteria bacterium]|nr:VWA domain-containing protein [Candidatus Riflebacteria bacterium]
MFKTPENLLILLVAAIWTTFLLRRLAADLRERRERFAALHMLERIVGHKPTRRPVLKWLMIVIALGLACLAAARPTGGYSEETLTGQGLDLVVALDVSLSMRALDIDGNARLDVAKGLISRLMNGLRNDRVGLVVFAGDTMVQAPLTNDKNTFLTFLERADPELLTKQGTNIPGAIETCIDRFDQTASQSKVIVLVSDGEDKDDKHDKRMNKVLEEARRKNIVIFTVGVGSKEGAPIPVSRDMWGELRYLTWKGETVISKMDDSILRRIAKETGGAYFRAADGKSAMEVAGSLEGLKRVSMPRGTRTSARELFPWPVLVAFLLLLVEWMISERIPFEREKDHWLKRL